MAPAKGKKASASAPENYKWATIDYIIIASFAIFCVIAAFIDYINAFAPVGGVTESDSKHWLWPPQFVFPFYFWWCRVCDPILQLNPLWIKYLSLLSPVVFIPFYIVAIYAIINKKPWIRIPCIMYASILFVDLSAFYVESVWGDVPSPHIYMFTAGYGYYQLFPLLLLYRFWADEPFGKQKASKSK